MGDGITVTLVVSCVTLLLTHPDVFEPLIVYVVDVVGATVKLFPVKLLGNNV